MDDRKWLDGQKAATLVENKPSDAPERTKARSEHPFVDRILASSPFQRVRVTDPTHVEFDVSSIHADAYQRIMQAADDSLMATQLFLKDPDHVPELVPESGLLLLGDAGVGKSHLLARVGKQCAKAGDGFVYLHNMQVRPCDLPRYVLKCFVNSLAFDRRDNFHHTPLYKLIDHAIRNAAQVIGVNRVTIKNLEQAITGFARYLQGDEAVFRVIFHFYFHSRRQLECSDKNRAAQHGKTASIAARWLKGDLVEAQHGKSIGILARPGTEILEMGDHQIQDAIITIARLAAVSKRRCILCFDQCENIAADSLQELSQFLQGLIDHGTPTNLVSIVAGVRSELLARLDQAVISTAAAARLNATRPVELRFLTRDEAKTLVHDRLHEFFERSIEVSEDAKPFFRNDSLFPLGEQWLAETMGDIAGFRPRDLMIQANDRWRENQVAIRELGAGQWLKQWPRLSDGTTVDPGDDPPKNVHSEILSKVEEEKNRQLLQPGLLPPDGGNMKGVIEKLLGYCAAAPERYSLRQVASGPRPDELKVVEECGDQVVRNAAKVVVTGSATSTAARLRQLIDTVDNERRVLVTDQRCELAMGAAGKSYFNLLTAFGDGFKHYKLSLAQYAEMHAMLAVIGEAHSGDVEVRGVNNKLRRITPEEVVECFHEQDLFRKQELLAEFLCEPTVPQLKPTVDMDGARFREFVRSRLALLMGANLSELLRRYALEHATDSTFDQLLPRARDVVMQMHDDEEVVATPGGNDLFLMVRPTA